MNEIGLHARPARRLLLVVAALVIIGVFLLPVFYPFDCSGGSGRGQWACYLLDTAGPYIAPFVPLVFMIGFWPLLLGKPAIVLSREGIDLRLYQGRFVPWASIAKVEIKKITLTEHLFIRRKLEATGTTHSSPRMLFTSMFQHRPTSEGDLLTSPAHIDRPLQHLVHWIEEGRQNAAKGVSPDPFFTPPPSPSSITA
jgi:hypothetical protein